MYLTFYFLKAKASTLKVTKDTITIWWQGKETVILKDLFSMTIVINHQVI